MSSAPSDRNLLFGVLALQMDFIKRDALIAAMHTWVLDKTRSLGEILVQHGTLQASQRSLLEPVVDAHLAMHGNDAEKSLAAVQLSTPLRRELHSVADADVQASLNRLPTPSARADSEPHLDTTDHPNPLSAAPTPAQPGLPLAALATIDEIRHSGNLRFQILRPHDKGGIGEVFVAPDQELNRQVALKEIQECLNSSTQ